MLFTRQTTSTCQALWTWNIIKRLYVEPNQKGAKDTTLSSNNSWGGRQTKRGYKLSAILKFSVLNPKGYPKEQLSKEAKQEQDVILQLSSNSHLPGCNLGNPEKKILSGYQSRERKMSFRDNPPLSTATDHCHTHLGGRRKYLAKNAAACKTNQALLSIHYETSDRESGFWFLCFFQPKTFSIPVPIRQWLLLY